MCLEISGETATLDERFPRPVPASRVSTVRRTVSQPATTASTKSLALIAGEGKLPELLAKSAKERGYRVVALALSKDAQARVTPHCDKVYLVAPGQLGRNIKLAEAEGLKEVVFIGKIPKLELLHNIYKLDW